MEHWKRLALPVGFGVAAAVLNILTIAARIKPEPFVAVKRSVLAGDTFAPEDLVQVELSGDLKALRQAAIPWTQRANLYYRIVPRDLIEGDIVLWRDATALIEELPQAGEDRLPITLSNIPSVPSLILVGQQIGFWIGQADDGEGPRGASGNAAGGEYVGPFRVLAVGERAAPGREGASASRTAMEQVLTLAVRLNPVTKELDEKTRRLVGASNRHGGLRILAILLSGSRRPDRALPEPVAPPAPPKPVVASRGNNPAARSRQAAIESPTAVRDSEL